MQEAICSVCGVIKTERGFMTACDRVNGTVSDKDLVFTRACQYANRAGCINVAGKLDKSKGYNSLEINTEQWLEAAKEINSRQTRIG